MKSEKLKLERGVSFDEIINGELVDVLRHPKKSNQKILVFEYKAYIWAVPCAMKGDSVFLKTLYPSRKLTSKYSLEK